MKPPADPRTWHSIWNAPAERLALFRFSVGVFSVIYLSVRYGSFTGVSRLEPGQFAPVGLVAWLDPVVAAPLAPGVVHGVTLATIIAAALFALGVGYRLVGPLFAFLLFWTTSYKSSFGMVFHTENLLTMHALALAFAPAADALSLKDRKRPARIQRRAAAPTERGSRFGAPLLCCCLITIIAYFLAGLAKWRLSGADWMSGDVLRIQVAYDNLRKIELGSIHSPIGAWSVGLPWLFPPLAALTMLAEFGGVLALSRRWLTLCWVGLIVGFHWGVLLLMAIGFAYPLSGVAFFPLFELERWSPSRRLLAWWRGAVSSQSNDT